MKTRADNEAQKIISFWEKISTTIVVVGIVWIGLAPENGVAVEPGWAQIVGGPGRILTAPQDDDSPGRELCRILSTLTLMRAVKGGGLTGNILWFLNPKTRGTTVLYSGNHRELAELTAVLGIGRWARWNGSDFMLAVEVVDPIGVIEEVGRIRGVGRVQNLSDLVSRATRELREGVAPVVTRAVADYMVAYSNEVMASVGGSTSRLLLPNVSSGARVNSSCGHTAFLTMIDALAGSGNGIARALLIRLAEGARSGLTARGWEVLARSICELTGLSERYCIAACTWWKFSTHTEAQMGALMTIGAVGRFAAMDLRDGCASLFEPCQSCRLIPWVARRRESFWCVGIDNCTLADLSRSDLELDSTSTYNWASIRRGIKEGL